MTWNKTLIHDQSSLFSFVFIKEINKTCEITNNNNNNNNNKHRKEERSKNAGLKSSVTNIMHIFHKLTKI